MITAKQIGLAACVVAVLLLGLSLFGGRNVNGNAETISGTEGLRVADAWIRLPAATGRPAGGFLTITAGNTADTLISVETPTAGRVEIHSMTQVEGVMRMRAEESLAIPAGGTLTLAPGGYHLMLFDLDPEVGAGDTITLGLHFQSGTQLEIGAIVHAAGAGADQGGHSSH